ncbi:MAG: DUF452 family protein [Paramuribaculum sp.]|nr:DUF452 family protein [Paramuribaculum sp.]
MNHAIVSHTGSSRLIIFFAGWGMDDTPFRNMRYPGYDVAVVWNYSESGFTSDFWRGYSEICILAWSYGVYYAGRFIENHPELPVTARVAVNGTLYPVDKEKGIPAQIFNVTLSALSQQNVKKFYRRMCGSSVAYESFMDNSPGRSVESLAAELTAIGDDFSIYGAPQCRWDKAYISANDRIFPPESQFAAWNDMADIITLPGAHLPDFSRILEESFILKDGVSDAFARSAGTYSENAPAQYFVAQHLASIIKREAPLSGNVVEIGCGSGFLTRLIAPLLTDTASLTLIDVSPIDSSLPGKHIKEDAETYMFQIKESSLSAILSASAVQWFNSPATFLQNALRVLVPGGILAVAVYADTTFNEIPELKSPSKVFSTESLKSIIPHGFEVDVCDAGEYVQEFESSIDVLRHFRLTGVAPVSPSDDSPVLARKILRSNITSLSYNPLFLLLTKKKYCNFVD